MQCTDKDEWLCAHAGEYVFVYCVHTLTDHKDGKSQL